MSDEINHYENGFRAALEASKRVCIEALKFWDRPENRERSERNAAGKQAKFLLEEIDRLYVLNNIQR